ncbi:MAG: hypothetical protein V1824_00825, partial [archaeon]
DLSNLELLAKLDIRNIYYFSDNALKDNLTKEVLEKAKSLDIELIKLNLVNDSSVSKKLNELTFAFAGDLATNYKLLNSKSIDILINPTTIKASFDSSLASIANENNKLICFDINSLRSRNLRVIKQTNFIIKLLQARKCDFVFCSLARTKEDLIDPKVLFYFLKSLGNLEDEFILKILDNEIICKRK